MKTLINLLSGSSIDIELDFQYRHIAPGFEINEKVNTTSTKGATICQVTVKFINEANILASLITTNGIARCHHLDNFDKSKGRRLSLKRALKVETFNSEVDKYLDPKELRTLIWELYNKRNAK